MDHVIPQAAGGTDDPENLVTACWTCNKGKGSTTLDGRPSRRGGRPRKVEPTNPAICPTRLFIAIIAYRADATYRTIHRDLARDGFGVPPYRASDETIEVTIETQEAFVAGLP